MPDSIIPSAPAPFAAGESLLWETREGNQLVRRQVGFQRFKHGRAVVSWGLNSEGDPALFTADPSELRRPVPPAPPARIEPPASSPPEPIGARREKLAAAYAAYQSAEAAVAAAAELVDRAQTRLEQMQAQLREFAHIEQRSVDDLVREIKIGWGNGESAADRDEEWARYERSRRDCANAEAAHDLLLRELAVAKAVAFERLGIVQRVAAQIVAGVVEHEVERLVELEQEAAELRARLRSAQMLWLAAASMPLGQRAAKLLIEPPTEIVEGVGQRQQMIEARQQVFVDLFARLVSGDAAADLPWRDGGDDEP